MNGRKDGVSERSPEVLQAFIRRTSAYPPNAFCGVQTVRHLPRNCSDSMRRNTTAALFTLSREGRRHLRHQERNNRTIYWAVAFRSLTLRGTKCGPGSDSICSLKMGRLASMP